MKKTDTQFRLQQNKEKLCQRAQWSPQEHPERDILQVNIENFMTMLLNMINQKIQEALKKFQDNKNKEYEKTQQRNELIGALN
jgi:hypothetical protein